MNNEQQAGYNDCKSGIMFTENRYKPDEPQKYRDWITGYRLYWNEYHKNMEGK